MGSSDGDGFTVGPVIPSLTVFEPEPPTRAELKPRKTGLLDQYGQPITRPRVAPEQRPVGFLHAY